jgi:hypothetical protein
VIIGFKYANVPGMVLKSFLVDFCCVVENLFSILVACAFYVLVKEVVGHFVHVFDNFFVVKVF